MKLKMIALITATAAALTMFSACSDKEKSSSDSQTKTTQTGGAVASGAAPVLTINNSEGKPGETVNVTVSLSGADQKWSMCGVHFSYDNTLSCVTQEDPKFAAYTQGDATKDMTAFVSAIWTENLIDELSANNKYSLFFASVGEGDVGTDGEIATFQFTIPADAQVGTVYPLEFFEYEGDMFSDLAADENLQQYAFTHWQGGSITVI